MNRSLEDRSFLLALLVVTVAFGYVLKPFFSAIFWAALLAIIFFPLQRKLESKWHGKKNLAACVTLLAITLMVIVPVGLLTAALANEGAALYQRIDQGEINLQQFIDRLKTQVPFLEEAAQRFNIDLDNAKKQISASALEGSKFLAGQAFTIGQGTFQVSLTIVICLYITFFFLRDGRTLVRSLIRALPLGDEREHKLFMIFAEVSRATIKGNLVVATVQGTLGGLIFWFLGINGALLWGVVMAVLSLLPAVGAAIVWIPAAIYLLVTGSLWEGVTLILFGVFVIGLSDNVLRPILVGRDTKLPDYVILLSTLGGISLFGIDGFVIGPVLAALFLAFWAIFTDEFNHEAIAKKWQSEITPKPIGEGEGGPTDET